VVNAAGYYAGQVARMFGREVPMMVMSHQYLLFDTIPELAEWTAQSGHKLPLLRDVDSSYYLRQEKMGFNLGPYENPAARIGPTPDDPMPEDFSFQLFPDDLDRLEWWIEDAAARVPLLAEARLQKVINGPIPYTPDGNPLIGPMPGVPNAFEACVFTFGICQAGGAGKVLAEWVTEGGDRMGHVVLRPAPVHRVRGSRLLRGKGDGGLRPRIRHPLPDPCLARPGATGSCRRCMTGWRRWARSSGPTTAGNARCGSRAPATTPPKAAQRTWGREGPWFGAVAAECAGVRDGCGVLDLPGFARFDLSGAGAAAWLDAADLGAVPRRAGWGWPISPTTGDGSSPR
jgi:dimethylglycine dehydrogenase